MKETEKIDIVLRGMYEFRETGDNVAPSDFIPELSLEGERRISQWLLDCGLATGSFSNDGGHLRITTEGIFYCEEDSFSQPGSSVFSITNVYNDNSPGTTIQIVIQGQVIYENAKAAIDEIRAVKSELESMKGVNNEMVSLIGECLDDLESKIDQRKSVPGYLWEWLSRFDNVTSLASKIVSVRKLIELN